MPRSLSSGVPRLARFLLFPVAMLHDLRIAFRSLRRRSGTTGTLVLILALGIATSTVVFSLVQAFLLRPLSFHEPDRLVRVWGTQALAGGDRLRVTEGAFVDWRREAEGFSSLVAARNMGMSVTESERPLNPLMREVSNGWFETLGLSPQLGRSFRPDDHEVGAKVAVLSYGFWQGYFGGDPDVVGRVVEMDYEPYEVIGVMPASYRNPVFPTLPVLWLPMPETTEPNRRLPNLVVVGRLDADVTLAEADAAVSAVAASLEARFPETDGGRGARIMPLHGSLVEVVEPALLALAVAVAFVLLIACANAANLLLARAVGRQGEIAVRRALGASRRHLLRQCFAESLLIGGSAAILGLIVATWSIGPLLRLAPSNTSVPLLDRVRIDAGSAAFAIGIALLTSLVFGLLPLLGGGQGDRAARSRSGGGHRRTRLRSALVVVEVAVSLTLLIGAGLMIRSFLQLRNLDLGFDPNGLLAVRATARGPEFGAPERQPEFFRRAIEQVRTIPGVEDAGAVQVMPMFASFFRSTTARAAETPELGEADLPRAVPLRATPGFFRAFGLAILSGRSFTADDDAGRPPVAVVSRSLARRVWGDQDPVGRTLVLGENERTVTIVGLADDVRGVAVAPEPPPNLYLPHAQDPVPSMSIFLRATGEPSSMFTAVEDRVATLSRDLPVYGHAEMRQVVRDIEWQPRFVGQLLAGFAIFALLLAVTGLYAVLSYMVAERDRELAVRVAVGADPTDIVRLVLRGAMHLAGLGVLGGLVGAWGASRLLASQLYDIAPSDPVTYAALSLVLLGVALLAAYLPARRAARIDPAVTLGRE